MHVRNIASSMTAFAIAALCTTLAAWPSIGSARDRDDNDRIEHVLLISVDGMHEVDLTHYIASHPKSAFARLVRHGVRYTHASASKPSDSFPGLLAFMTGGSPLSHG